MVYDLGLVKPTKALFDKFAPTTNQVHIKRPEVKISAQDLLLMPAVRRIPYLIVVKAFILILFYVFHNMLGLIAAFFHYPKLIT